MCSGSSRTRFGSSSSKRWEDAGLVLFRFFGFYIRFSPTPSLPLQVRAGVGDGIMDQVERGLLVAAGDAAVATGKSWTAWTPDRAAYLGNVLQR